ncbi:MAG: hypothetical protein IPJ65_27330 [Archangiaceae bacterium]|nr:hypothetical protein [Archangiaceae bacterium]
MAIDAIWVKRVEQWQRSGLSSEAFAAGKSFTGGGLRHMAHRVRSESRGGLQEIALARVVTSTAAPSSGETPVVVDFGGVRIEVRRGASRDALALVLDVLKSGR